MAEGYKDMSPRDAAEALKKSAELVAGGAKISEGGRIEVTPEQQENARIEMVVEEVQKRGMEIVELCSTEAVRAKLEERPSVINLAILELLKKTSGRS